MEYLSREIDAMKFGLRGSLRWNFEVKLIGIKLRNWLGFFVAHIKTISVVASILVFGDEIGQS